MEPTHPTFGNGKICYIQIPAADVKKSAQFYRNVFGWNIRERANGEMAFDDGVGEVSGMWLAGKEAETDPRVMLHIMVDSTSETAKSIVSHGGKIVQPVEPDAHEITALFADPAGNVFGIYPHRSGKS